MANWKELGEVPDSEEDDDFDSQDLDAGFTSLTTKTTAPATTPTTTTNIAAYQGQQQGGSDEDIWNIPDSPQSQVLRLSTATTPIDPRHLVNPLRSTPEPLDSSPLSSAKSDQELPSIENLIARRWALSHPHASRDAGDRDRDHDQQDEISRSHVEITTPVPEFNGVDDIPWSSELPRSRDRTSPPPLPSQILGHDEEEQDARQVAVRYERSLRPRKPIQEHPYILENAHYSSVLKRHGVKPVRAIIEAERERQRREATAQDGEFQEASQDSQLLGNTEDSQLPDSSLLPPDFGSLELPSSSPPKTSPLYNRARASSQTSSQDGTDNTSVAEHDLPALEDLLKRSTSFAKNAGARQRDSPPRSTARKRRRQDIIESDPIEPRVTTRMRIQESPDPLFASFLGSQPNRNPSPVNAVPLPSSPPDISTPARNQSTPQAAPVTFTIDSDSDEEAVPGQQNTPHVDENRSDSESDSPRSGSELVNNVGRRMRGVLPASWLRLDQKSGPGKAQKDAHRQPRDQSPGREQRRGVAQRRQALPGSTTNQFIFEDSEEETAPLEKTTDDVFHNQTRLLLQPTQANDTPLSLPSDDDSVVEDNVIDHMVSGRKRQLKLSDSFRGEPKRRKIAEDGARQPPRRPKQPKITSHFDNPGHAASGTRPPKRHSNKPKRSKQQGSVNAKRSKNASGRVPPPRLSILDVIEPDAPAFLKIAARAAKRRPNQGRSSPSRKTIKLATRRDHVDVVSVLSDWRAGSIRPRPSVSAARRAPQQPKQPRPVAEQTGGGSGTLRTDPRIFTGISRKLVKQVSDSGTVRYLPSDTTRKSEKKQMLPAYGPSRQSQGPSTKPAQLETDGIDQPSKFAFHARKRWLDRLYQKSRGELSLASSVGVPDSNIGDQLRASPSPDTEPQPPNDAGPSRQKQPQRLRFHKRTKPQHIDLEAPEYSHANDPLPVQYTAVPEQTQVENGSKLLGLGPYGTHYTHHFEIFPLDSRVYFHNSTLVGGGAVEAATSNDYGERLTDARPRVSFSLGDQVLRWGPWNSQVSSELGILLDFVTDQLEGSLREARPPDASTMLNAVSFVLNYVQNSLSFTEDEGSKPFVARAYEALKGFDERVGPQLHQLVSDQGVRYELVLRIYDRLLLVTLLTLRVCQKDSSLMNEKFQVEGLLKSMTKTAVSTLVHAGLSEVRKTYEDLNQLRFRERGLRGDRPAIHSWVVAMKVLDFASIPRSSFWDIVQAVLATPQAIESTDAQVFEKIWEDMFSLLPLIEFNNVGVVISGQRHDTGSDGWALPQKLLKRVFQLYRENTHQAPSFNNYCRALVGRCHYLVQQWGWRKSVTVIGVIFDFFGSQNLEHLRNEEVYKSPRFLDELAGRPMLDIEPEDRCFHVFLKLIALSIRKLRETDSINDIRNLIARTMPNHNRQHLKEQKIHERDLAALRNHHDLLSTLFWASPAELRPGAARIETLVVPASSHKEACLINLRAWNQLARFIVASGEATRSFRPFSQWRNNFFEQMMRQYDSVASDIQQQLTSLSKDDRQSINPNLINTMVSMNKGAVMDVLHLSVTASLDVMKRAPDLEAATFTLNTPQLQLVFKHFTVSPPELDWAILRASLATLDSFLSRVEEFQDNEESQQSESQLLNSAQADDVILVLDQSIASNYFSMARCILSARASRNTAAGTMDKASCTEQAVILSARMGIRFMNGGLMKLSDMFKYGKYGLFDGPPHKLSLDQRRHLALFIATLLKHGFNDFSDVDFTLPEVWALSLVKPREYLGYENQLAVQLKRRQSEYVPEAAVGLTMSPDYNNNRDMFEFVVSTMRRSINDAGPMLKKIRLAEHTKTVKLVMEQIKGDLRTVVQDTAEHPSYVVFVRDIISLIRSHGPENCAIDDFFYQMSREYSPSVQDPQLQVASMVSYGLRLKEGDARAVHPLFYFLFNNFKLSMNSDKLGEEAKMLRKGIDNPGLRSFFFGKMLPAIIRASFSDSSAFLLMDVYVEALRLYLSGTMVAHELREADLPHLIVTLRAIVDEISKMRQSMNSLPNAQIHLIRQLMAVLNLMWPSFYALSLSRVSSPIWTEVTACLKRINDCTEPAENYTNSLLDVGDSEIQPGLLFGGVRDAHGEEALFDTYVTGFTDNIVNDIRKNWVVVSNRITTQAPGKARGMPSTQSGQGIEDPAWDPEEMLQDLQERIREWRYWWEEVFGEPVPKRYPMSIVF